MKTAIATETILMRDGRDQCYYSTSVVLVRCRQSIIQTMASNRLI